MKSCDRLHSLHLHHPSGMTIESPLAGERQYRSLFDPTFIFTIKTATLRSFLERSFALNCGRSREASDLPFMDRGERSHICCFLLFMLGGYSSWPNGMDICMARSFTSTLTDGRNAIWGNGNEVLCNDRACVGIDACWDEQIEHPNFQPVFSFTRSIRSLSGPPAGAPLYLPRPSSSAVIHLFLPLPPPLSLSLPASIAPKSPSER